MTEIVRFTAAEDVPYSQGLWFSLKLEQTQRVCTERPIGCWWIRIVIKRTVDKRGTQRVL